MINYRYYLDDLEDNSQSYVEKQHIECTEQIRHLCASDAAQVNGSSRL